MRISKPQDFAAGSIQFGVELETIVPIDCRVAVGPRHVGHKVHSGYARDGTPLAAPAFGGFQWLAEADGSVTSEPGYMACEFVSPILDGDEGLANLREFLRFANGIGAKVNHSCGLHITVGIASVIGAANTSAVAEFIQKLAHIAQHNAWAIYAQTGSGRHLNSYAASFPSEVEQWVKEMKRAEEASQAAALATRCGRKRMVNFCKAFTGANAAVEFRAFAGTLSEPQIMHHLATVLGLMRRAATVQTFGRFDRKATKKHSHIQTAVEALRRMWRVLGWVDSVPGRECALGLFGSLHSEFGTYRRSALENAREFERRFPAANL